MDMIRYLQKRGLIVSVQLGTGPVLIQPSRPVEGMAHETFLTKLLFSYAEDGRLSPPLIRYHLADEARRREFMIQLERYEEIVKEDLAREGYAVNRPYIQGFFLAAGAVLSALAGTLLILDPAWAAVPASGAFYSFFQAARFPWVHHTNKMPEQVWNGREHSKVPFLFQDPGEFKAERSIVPVYAAGSGAMAAGSFQLDEFGPELESVMAAELINVADHGGNDG
ncbi:DUF2207 domain-containing protein [Alkalicoccus luteus]|uniref:DUF2207 domain-containing protein n=1 Tax=Alkalicoccus luteus TaxID=1237094 RepID=UPI001439C912|nr:DUF2207 domain-containing protein [Alkalicoccus luteus]